MNLENYRSNNPSVRRIQIANKKRKIKENFRQIKSFFWIMIIIRTLYLIKSKQISPLLFIPIYNNFKTYLMNKFSRNPLHFYNNMNSYFNLYNSFLYVWKNLPST